MEIGRQSLEVTVLGKTILGVGFGPLSLGLEVHLSRTERGFLGDEVVAVDGFWVRQEITIHVVETKLVVSLIGHLFFLGEVFGVGAAEEGTVSCLAEPVGASLEVVSVVLVFFSLGRLAYELFGVGTFAPEGEA